MLVLLKLNGIELDFTQEDRPLRPVFLMSGGEHMQEEVENRTWNLVVSTTRLSVRTMMDGHSRR